MAKELYLVDDFDKIYKRIQRPAAAVAKARSSIKMMKTLVDRKFHDDEKVRRYVSLLHRLLNVRDSTSAQPQQSLRRRRQLIPKSAEPTRHYYYRPTDEDEYYTDSEVLDTSSPPPPAVVDTTAPAKRRKKTTQRRMADTLTITKCWKRHLSRREHPVVLEVCSR